MFQHMLYFLQRLRLLRRCWSLRLYFSTGVSWWRIRFKSEKMPALETWRLNLLRADSTPSFSPTVTWVKIFTKCLINLPFHGRFNKRILTEVLVPRKREKNSNFSRWINIDRNIGIINYIFLWFYLFKTFKLFHYDIIWSSRNLFLLLINHSQSWN